MPQPSDSRAVLTTSDGCTIGYTLRNAARRQAPRIVLVHSLALDERVWLGVAAQLDGEFHVLTYDCRGHGRSNRGALPFSAALFARDLGELLDAVQWPSAIVAGCSMGGNIAQAFAAAYPGRTLALALIDTTAWYGEDAPARWQERADTARAQGLSALVHFQVARWLGDGFRAAHPEIVHDLVHAFLANDIDAYAGACALLAAADSRATLPTLRMPVTVVVGEQDYATPIASAQAIHDAIAGSELVILPGARHLTPVECPEAIGSALRALADRIAPAASRIGQP